MASMASIRDEAMKALEGSLASTIEHNRQLEAKLSAASSELATVNAKRATETAEMHELRAALEERDAQIEKLSSKAEESTAESEQAKQRLMAMRQAGQLLLGKLGAAVLSAQEMKTQARPLEEKLIPIATGAPRAL